ncbi:50S ribosomal protein L10 [Oceanivirga salmonicida]|uniref:50S ribosomal protein L10 n=1 Tax=Oceanivirga salmonicida TaxID=1769291 RepID=UPI000830A10F|nr:50S ribosomal protein L10 [Oceanivirga salmonicida]
MPAQYKVDEVERLASKLEGAKAVIFVDYKGITVNQDTKLRKSARENNVEYFVAKNRLVILAFKKLGIEPNFGDLLEGTTSFAVGYEDAVGPSKTIYEFAKENKKIQIKGGFYDGKIADKELIEALAKLPSRDEMLGMIAYGLLSPVRMLAVAMTNVAEQKEA